MGYLPASSGKPVFGQASPEPGPVVDVDEIKNWLTQYPENEYMRGLVYQYVEKWPAKKFTLLPDPSCTS
jgi:hypothetical protein